MLLRESGGRKGMLVLPAILLVAASACVPKAFPEANPELGYLLALARAGEAKAETIYTLSGFLSDENDLALGNSTLKLVEQAELGDESNYRLSQGVSNSVGDFSIGLPAGSYKYQVLDGSDEELGRFTLDVKPGSALPVVSEKTGVYKLGFTYSSDSGKVYFAPRKLEYAETDVAYGVNLSLSNTPVTQGSITEYSATPALPDGLTLGSDGVIRGAPEAPVMRRVYIITGRNSFGSISTRVFLGAVHKAPANLQYPFVRVGFRVNASITEMALTMDGNPAEFKITPELPTGLTISQHDGSISGKPLVTSSEIEYTVTAKNEHGTAQTLIKIEVTAI